MTREQALSAVTAACSAGKLTQAAADNIREWLTEDRYAEYAQEVMEHIHDGAWQQLDDVFWTVIPFGTGGRRGRMYPIGTNAINDRTIGESAQGLADYILAMVCEGQGARPTPESLNLSCAIAYDTRHRSAHFAKLCTEIMTAAGFKVYFLDGYRSTPELSFTVRQNGCTCGIMVTASHNPPSDNAVKVYWETGGQVLPPHDRKIIDRVMHVEKIQRIPWDEAVRAGQVLFCQEAMDAAFIDAVLEQAEPGPRNLKIIYSPLHGVGATAVCPVLSRDGFHDVEIFAPHASPDGDFPNVPNHISNPENPAVFNPIIQRAQEIGADLVIATDPDCDRIGCAAPRKWATDSWQKNRAVEPGEPTGIGPSEKPPWNHPVANGDASARHDRQSPAWQTLTGNQIGALLTDFVLECWKKRGKLTPDHYLVETLVTTQLIRRIGDSYGVRTEGDLLVGFKWIAGVIDRDGPDRFLFGAEESHGFMAGTHVRDKDGAVAAMLLCELAAELKAEGKTLHERLDALFWQYGAHAERTVSVQMPGSQGMADMKTLMELFRGHPPAKLAGFPIVRIRDYLNGVEKSVDGDVVQPLRPFASSPLPPGDASKDRLPPQGDLVMLDLACPGNYAAVRPSGTEPKVKFYLFGFEPPEQIADLEATKAILEDRLAAMERDLRNCADASTGDGSRRIHARTDPNIT
ncbi:MAG: phospho-sugar mutase [Pirellulales bacterium]|nr:phospho-sugar mutase [Pirellulales bacterium]